MVVMAASMNVCCPRPEPMQMVHGRPTRKHVLRGAVKRRQADVAYDSIGS